MDKFYIQWNLINWVTIVLMATFGLMIVGLASSAIRQYREAA